MKPTDHDVIIRLVFARIADLWMVVRSIQPFLRAVAPTRRTLVVAPNPIVPLASY